MAAPSPPHAPFSTHRLRRRKARAGAGFAAGAFLHQRVAEDLAERLSAVNRPLGPALCVGGAGAFAAAVNADPEVAARVAPLFGLELSAALPGATVVGDPEHLPIGEGALGLYASVLALHWANDLPGALIQARRALKPDGLLLAAFFGGRTLHELRAALLAAEAEIRGGAGLRVAPFAEVQDGAHLLQRAGFALPVADSDTIVVRYADPLHLLTDLRAMGETSALAEHAGPLTRGVLFRALEIYRARFADADGRVSATFEVITLTGWAPHESQQKPLKPGSAKTRLADALGVQERKV